MEEKKMKKNLTSIIATAAISTIIGFGIGNRAASLRFDAIKAKDQYRIEQTAKLNPGLVAQPWKYNKEVVSGILSDGYGSSTTPGRLSSGIGFKTIKGDTPERLAEIMYNNKTKWREIYDADGNNLETEGYGKNTPLHEGLPMFCCLNYSPDYAPEKYEEEVRAFQNTFPQREAIPVTWQVLKRTRNPWKYTPRVIDAIISDGYALLPGRGEEPPRIDAKKVVFETQQGDQLWSLAMLLYNDSDKFTLIQGYNSPALYKTYDEDAGLPSGLKIRAWMTPGRLEVFQDNFPERHARVIR
jgi:hypothetical protein